MAIPGSCSQLIAWMQRLMWFGIWEDLSTSLAAYSPKLTPAVGSLMEGPFVQEVGINKEKNICVLGSLLRIVKKMTFAVCVYVCVCIQCILLLLV